MKGDPTAPLVSRLYRALLLALPPSFRRRYGSELAQMVADRAAERGVRGSSLRGVAFWIGELTDLLRTCIREWWSLRPFQREASHPLRSAAAEEHSNTATRLVELMYSFVSDIRFAVRALQKQPVYALVVVLTVAIGIGANTTVFALVNSVLLRPLPYPAPDRLIYGFGSFPQNLNARVSPPDYLDYRERSESFAHLAAYYAQSLDLTGSGPAERVRGEAVSHNLFAALGVEPAMGRAFTAEEEGDGAPRVAVIGHGFWLRRFGRQPDMLGRTLLLDGEAYTIVGVMPAGFQLFSPSDVWFPIRFDAEGMAVRRFHFLRLVGRLHVGVTLPQAQQEIDQIAAELQATYPESNTGWTLNLQPLHAVFVGGVSTPLWILMGSVALVLLIVCGNVASVSLARGSARQGEVAVRTALGASRRRIMRLLLTESGLLALVGGGLGVLIATRALDVIKATSAAALVRVNEISIDGVVLVFTLAVSVVTGILFGLAPALQAGKSVLVDTLRSASRISDQRARRRFQSGLVVAQVALTMMLLAGAGLLIKSLWRLTQVDPGFDPRGVMTASVLFTSDRYEELPSRVAFVRGVLQQLETTPSVRAAAAINILPFSGGNDTKVFRDGAPMGDDEQVVFAQFRFVSGPYFSTMRIPLLAGRALSPSDGVDVRKVAVIGDSLARQLFPNDDPVGKRLAIDLGDTVLVEVVGIVGGVRQFSLPPNLACAIARDIQRRWSFREGHGTENRILFTEIRTDPQA